jgi:hypothetical protein
MTMIDYLSKMYGRRNPYFEAMLKEGTNTSPIGAHSQGWSRMAHALIAGLERGKMDREEREWRERTAGRLVPKQVPAFPVGDAPARQLAEEATPSSEPSQRLGAGRSSMEPLGPRPSSSVAEGQGGWLEWMDQRRRWIEQIEKEQRGTAQPPDQTPPTLDPRYDPWRRRLEEFDLEYPRRPLRRR